MNTLILLLIVAAAVVAVSLPLIRAGRSASVPATGPRYPNDAAIDAAVERYRVALRAGTVCERCRYAGPAHSRYCADCGHGIKTSGHNE